MIARNRARELANLHMTKSSWLCKLARHHIGLEILGPVWDGGYSAHCRHCKISWGVSEQPE